MESWSIKYFWMIGKYVFLIWNCNYDYINGIIWYDEDDGDYYCRKQERWNEWDNYVMKYGNLNEKEMDFDKN